MRSINMPVMRNLVGFECARCREAGHWCQAQIWIDDVPLCLRCADDEPCIFITAAQIAEAMPVELDPCTVPRPSREDLRAVRSMPLLPSIYATVNVDEHLKVSDSVKAAILADTGLSSSELVRKYRLCRETIANIVRRQRRRLREQARQKSEPLI
jgi:hypothetical protein